MAEPIDTIRQLVGDTDIADQLLDDTAIERHAHQNSLLDSGGGTISTNVYAAGADAAGAIAAKFARGFTFADDRQSFNLSERVSNYRGIEDDLRRKAGGYSAKLDMAGTTPTT